MNAGTRYNTRVARMKSQHGWFVTLAAALVLSAAGCGAPGENGSPSAYQDPVGRPGLKKMKLSTTAFQNEAPIPKKYTEDGDDVSPPLTWSDVPEGTKSFALICDDPDAPSPRRPAPKPWVHWVIYNIPADTRELPESVRRQAEVVALAGAKQGLNSWSAESADKTANVGYRGPAPPKSSGPHRYFFSLYALDTMLELNPATADKETLVKAMGDHVLAEGQTMGTYERK